MKTFEVLYKSQKVYHNLSRLKYLETLLLFPGQPGSKISHPLSKIKYNRIDQPFALFQLI
jgi:hypothetical protein